MGTCLAANRPRQQELSTSQLVYGPEFVTECPLEFHSHASLWQMDLNRLTQTIDSALTEDILQIIFDYVTPDIYHSIGYPYHFLIDTAVHHSTESLQPYSKSDSIAKRAMSRKSYSIFQESLIHEHIIADLSGIHSLIPPELQQEHIFRSVEWRFHEIVVYDKGGHFSKHVDTVFESTDGITFSHTLLLLPPCEYTGGELILYDASTKKVCISSNDTKWRWVIFHKHVPHECLPIRQGYKIVFKLHIGFGAELEFGQDLDAADVAFEPLATGIPGMTAPHVTTIPSDEVFRMRQEFGQANNTGNNL